MLQRTTLPPVPPEHFMPKYLSIHVIQLRKRLDLTVSYFLPVLHFILPIAEPSRTWGGFRDRQPICTARICDILANCINRSGDASSVWIEMKVSSLFCLHCAVPFQRHPLCKTVRHSMDRVTREPHHPAQQEVVALNGLRPRTPEGSKMAGSSIPSSIEMMSLFLSSLTP